jgi:hypothetical protein
LVGVSVGVIVGVTVLVGVGVIPVLTTKLTYTGNPTVQFVVAD